MEHQEQSIKELEEKYAKMNLVVEETGGVEYEELEEEEDGIDTRWALVGQFLSDIPIDFNAMKNMMAGLWKPGMGMYVKELGNNRYLFQMAHEIDIARVLDGSPWSFNRAPLIFKRLKPGENLMESNLTIWIFGFKSMMCKMDLDQNGW